jgi:sterol desaturase/sphingolipid hydroxylase (fatty acid hydroxylase superfamily)
MQLSRAGFFADFYVYPCAAAAVGTLAIASTPRHWPALGLACLAGLATWTLVEYVMHRWAFHHAPWIRKHHEAHHLHPKALLGTPTWLSFVIFLAFVMIPSVLATSLAIGSSFTAGFLLAYVWYVAVHYASHHWHAEPRGYFSGVKRRHAVHHYNDIVGNFGVTTPLWDHVFGTQVVHGPVAKRV